MDFGNRDLLDDSVVREGTGAQVLEEGLAFALHSGCVIRAHIVPLTRPKWREFIQTDRFTKPRLGYICIAIANMGVLIFVLNFCVTSITTSVHLILSFPGNNVEEGFKLI